VLRPRLRGPCGGAGARGGDVIRGGQSRRPVVGQAVQRHGNSTDDATSVAVSPGGGTVYVTGSSPGTTSFQDYATVGYNAATGAQLWVSRYNGPSSSIDEASSVAVSPDGKTVFVTGSSDASAGGVDYATVAYSAATGAQLWVKQHTGPASHGCGQARPGPRRPAGPG
jgi:DNA-binding beta-propeller fold protein YncE